MINMRVTGGFSPIKAGRTITRKVPHALKEGLNAAKNIIINQLVSEYYLKRGDVSKAVKPKLSASSTKYHTSYIKITGPRLSLEKYKLLPAKPPKRRKVIKAGVRRDTGIAPLGRAFLYAPGGGKFKPFARRGDTRLPIDKLVGPAIPQLVQWNEELQEKAVGAVRYYLRKALQEVMK